MLPLGLAYVGAALAPHHDVRLLLPDTRALVGGDPWAEVRAALSAEAPDLVGVAAATATLPAAARVAAEARAVLPAATVVVGGVHPTVDPEGTLAAVPEADLVVVGEGEATLAELAAWLEAGRDRASLARIDGLCLRGADGRPCRTPPRPPAEDLDALPDPLREGLVWPADVHPSLYRGLVTQRGCPYGCLFCAAGAVAGRRTRVRSPGHVLAEVERMRARHGVSGLFFHDSVFTLDRGRTLDLCRRLAGAALPFQCQTRVDRLDPGVVSALRDAGCTHVLLGIESGDEETLARIGKPTPLPAVQAAVALVRAAGMRCTGFFIVGFPWETEAHVRRTADLACGLGLDAIDLFSATPLPGSALWDLAGGPLPAGVDFRTPALNLTALPDAEYRRLYAEVEARIRAYNAGSASRTERGRQSSSAASLATDSRG